MTSTTHRARVRAPELAGRGWLNTGGRDLTLAGLRGKVVLLDFWTFCCVNCLHVLDELRPLEERYGDVLVMIGVHSPKFEHEADPDALVAAVERYQVHHPVLDDPELLTWSNYAARAWPTLTVVDPEGYVVAQLSGEGHAHGLGVLLDELVAEHEAKGTLHRGDGPYVPPPAPSTALRFPGKVVVLPGGTFLVSDTAHHQLVELETDLVTERRRFGDGERGLRDGAAGEARFSEPQGLLVLPDDVATATGYDVLVADTVNHALRGLRLADGAVTTVAGTGRQLRQRSGEGAALEQDLSSPWDLAWFDGQVVVAMAGTHQLWSFDPAAGTVRVLAGTSAEGIRDGAAHHAWFAQPSGLTVSPDGATLWVADSETSAVRSVRVKDVEGARYEVLTAVGTGLFDFGHVDGPAAEALLQHPLGVTVLPDGSVAVCDTYNGAVRRLDPETLEVSTLARGLAEPSDAVVEVPDGVEGQGGDPVLVVVESGAHRLTRVAIPAQAQRVDGGARRTQRPVTDLAPGEVALSVSFVPPSGQKLDHRYGDPTRLSVSATPASLLVEGEGTATGLTRTLRIAPDVPDGVLHVSVQAAACDSDAEFAACHLYQQDWGIPVRTAPNGSSLLELHLRGT